MYTFILKHDKKHIFTYSCDFQEHACVLTCMHISMDNYKRNYAKMDSRDILGKQQEGAVGGDGFLVKPS